MTIAEMVEQNIGLAHAQIHKFKLGNDDDAYSYAYEGLFLAAKGFDAEKGYKFSTYATSCIYNKLCEYLRIKARAPLVLFDDEVADRIEAEDLLSYSITVDNINATLNEFSSTHKLILTTWFKLGFNQRTTGKQLGYSQGYINKVVASFRYKLKTKGEI
jgi:RNA polymerase sigma factor (sigma-70 family)